MYVVMTDLLLPDFGSDNKPYTFSYQIVSLHGKVKIITTAVSVMKKSAGCNYT